MLLVACSVEQSDSKLTEMINKSKTRESDEESEISTNVCHHVCQTIRYQLLLPEDCQLLSQLSELKDSQFESPWHHEGHHLRVFW